MEKIHYRRALYRALVLLAVAALLFGLSLYIKKAPAEDPEQTVSVTRLSPDSVQRIVCLHDGESYELSRENGQWLCAGMDQPPDQEYIDALCGAVCGIEAVRVLENAAQYRESFSLNTPSCQVRVYTDTEDFSLEIGMYNLGTGTWYAALGSEPDRVYLLRDKYVEPLLLESAALLPGIDAALPDAAQLSRIDLSSPSGDFSIVKNDGVAADLYADAYRWALVGVYSQPAPAYDSRVSAFISKLLSLGESQRIDYKPEAEALAAYGLDSGARVRLTYQCEGEGEKTLELRFSQPDQEGLARFTDAVSGMIYQLQPEDYQQLSRNLSPYYLLARELCPFPLSELRSLQFSSGSGSLLVDVSSDGPLRSYSSAGVELEPQSFETFYSALSSLKSEGYLPPESFAMPDRIADSVTVEFTLSSGERVLLSLDSVDANFYLARIGPIETALVSKTAVQELKDLLSAINA